MAALFVGRSLPPCALDYGALRRHGAVSQADERLRERAAHRVSDLAHQDLENALMAEAHKRTSQAGILFGQMFVVAGVSLGVWSAAQWTAHALAHQARLGGPWFELSGVPAYQPWKLFEWWYFYGAYAPELFERVHEEIDPEAPSQACVDPSTAGEGGHGPGT